MQQNGGLTIPSNLSQVLANHRVLGRNPVLDNGTAADHSAAIYFAVFLAFAQRAFCAAAILARASGESWRFFRADFATNFF